ncbi:hypothetical protein ABIA25_001625 [Sinorhizobium fredii]|uniref:hypothetical protein n=1 Tax=Rhizobium fredii TaxID=380 RepID=UPI0035187C4F
MTATLAEGRAISRLVYTSPKTNHMENSVPAAASSVSENPRSSWISVFDVASSSRPAYINFHSLSSVQDENLIDEVRFWNVFAVLGEMHDLPEGTDQAIDDETYKEAERILGFLKLYDIPAPEVFSHGGDAVVFTWDGERTSRYATVSGGELGVLDVNRKTRVECAYPQIPLTHEYLDNCLNRFMRLSFKNHAAK